HIKNSAHVPLFVENDDGDIGTIIKRTVHNNFAGLFFGLPFTKRNLEFTKMVKDKFSPESKLLVVCQEGLRSTGSRERRRRHWTYYKAHGTQQLRRPVLRATIHQAEPR
ncbi:hypothetical protein, partial [Salmonella sp. s58313]|uniref:hypothetical protein n=1 Tax=Salmonella sp. s58313 TaxID=3160131 RepID=UPI0037543FEF